jgi:hypothetical protein
MAFLSFLTDCGVALRADDPVSDWVRGCEATFNTETSHLTGFSGKADAVFRILHRAIAGNLGAGFVFNCGAGYCGPRNVPQDVYALVSQARSHLYEKKRGEERAARTAAAATAERERRRAEMQRKREEADRKAIDLEVARRVGDILQAERAAVRETEINLRVAERLATIRGAAAAPAPAAEALPVYAPALPAGSI